MTERHWMKEPCGLCPFSRVGTLFLYPERAEEFAYSALNPFNDFVCHKTGVVNEDDYEGAIERGPKSLTCCGFLSLQVSECGDDVKGFEPHPDAFESVDDMIAAHEEHHDAMRRRLDRNK